MATVNAPYGLRPVNLLGGLPYAGSTREYLIDPAGYNANIFFGSVVALNTNGYVQLVTATGADGSGNVFPAGTVGVAVGFTYYNAQGQFITSQYYPANTTGDVRVMVVDDDRVVFSAQLTGKATQAVLGSNTFFSAAQSTSTGSTRTGNSTSALTLTTQTASAAFRIVGFASPLTDDFTEVLVKFNPGFHSFSNATGI